MISSSVTPQFKNLIFPMACSVKAQNKSLEGTKLQDCFGNLSPVPGGGGGNVLPRISYMGMCGAKGHGWSLFGLK